MPVRVRFLNGIQTLTVGQIYTWVRRSDANIPNDPATQRILQTFLTNWNQTYGFLQQAEFLRHLKMYVDQVELLNGIRDLGEQIIRDYPPHVFLYVGVGRSPAPIIAYFENIRVQTLTIPLSDFRPRNQNWSITDDILVQHTPQGAQGRPRISATQQTSLFAHFGRYFPAQPARKRILVIDYTQSAQSLVAAQEQLQNYFLSRNDTQNIEVHALAICRDSDAATVRAVAQIVGAPRNMLLHPVDWWSQTGSRQSFAQRWHVLPIAQVMGQATPRQTLVMQALSGQRFDNLAEYGSFKILGANPNLVRYTNDLGVMAAYAALREELQNATSK